MVNLPNGVKRIFFSYSHADAEFANRVADELARSAVPVWIDKWDIEPGDSIVQKIFNEGLANCEVFLVLLSRSSVESEWVKQEMDTAIVRKIEGLTKIIPLIREKCDIPLPMRSL